MNAVPPSEPPIQPSRKQLAWFLLIRLLAISVFLGGAIFFQFRGETVSVSSLNYLYGLIAAAYLHGLASAISLPRVANLRFFTLTQLGWDLLFCLFLIYFTGGVESLFSFSLVFVIIASSVFFDGRRILLVAALAAILFGLLIDLQYFGRLPMLPGLALATSIGWREAFYAIFVHVTGFLLTALLCAALSERWRRSEQALREQRIDYDELESLNRVILENIGSGLMIINPLGRIRSFNRAAEQITGYDLKSVYNREVRGLFPQLEVYSDAGMRPRTRAEAVIRTADEEERTLGFAATPIHDPQGRDIGLLVSFQDLTRIKQMEEDLRRADRLAAVGRLASAMAHEIRNPLASISGSVQLLMEGAHVTDEDRRLMGIVVREADRLSALLTDFLAYARPRKPQVEACDMAKLVTEVVQACGSDARFRDINIDISCPGGTRMLIDHDQVRQSLWDLLINAAEALEGEGRIRVSLVPETGDVMVEDSGPGVPDDKQERIFEPFFTTKAGGTGLGLATVHSIVEGHGGHVSIERGSLGGACFRLRFGPDAVLN
ncbi:MAG: PAS domain S-box protein [Deltaproteobacteria bacterium]|nr:MAG: PAS domain S-box protein [Deltaproteobacteria bacterium]